MIPRSTFNFPLFPKFGCLLENMPLKISNFPANSGKVRYPNEKVPSVAIAHRPAREMAILVDPPRAKALGDQLRDNPLDFVSWISPAIFP